MTATFLPAMLLSLKQEESGHVRPMPATKIGKLQ